MLENNKAVYKKLVVTEILPEAKRFKLFVLEEAGKVKITYKAGQYITLVHRHKNEEVRRSYSITSSPALQEPLTIGVKRIDNGFFSRQLIDRVQVGDQLITIGSGGFFVLPEEMHLYRQLFFLAAGSGITPIFSLIKTALAQFPGILLTLIYSNHSPQETIFLERLKNLEAQYRERLRIEFLFSIDPVLYRAHLHAELLNHFLQQYVLHKHQTLFYVCGPEAYMRMCQYTLQEAQVQHSQIKKEIFAAHKGIVLKQAPPDKRQYEVVIKIKSKTVRLHVQYPVSILETAKRHGIVLPYSCETGKCGSCVAKCTGGRVWMAYNEVLTDRDIQQGLVLTCTGYPVDGDVQLEF